MRHCLLQFKMDEYSAFLKKKLNVNVCIADIYKNDLLNDFLVTIIFY